MCLFFEKCYTSDPCIDTLICYFPFHSCLHMFSMIHLFYDGLPLHHFPLEIRDRLHIFLSGAEHVPRACEAWVLWLRWENELSDK